MIENNINTNSNYVQNTDIKYLFDVGNNDIIQMYGKNMLLQKEEKKA